MNEVKIGLEVHVQLVNLRTKLFCSCSSDYRGKPPNLNICPVCTGLPGSMPSLNKKAVEEALKIAIMLNAQPYPVSYFFRKSYFYPDLPKNFQITQYDKAGGYPLAHDGSLKLTNGKVVRIERIHLEEDPGRIVYEGSRATARYSLIDYNRSGIALVEIVTAPDMSSAEEARDFVERLTQGLEDIGMSIKDFEGALRVDVNVSYAGGERVEIKNITGASSVEKAVIYEVFRQKTLYEKGIRVVRETRAWDEKRRITISSRSKEFEEEYRYMPEPDLPPIVISESLIERIKDEIKGSYEQRYESLLKDGINEELARKISSNRELYRIYELVRSKDSTLKAVAASVLANELSYLMKRDSIERLPDDVSGLVKILTNYDSLPDHSTVVEYLRKWISGEEVVIRTSAPEAEDLRRQIEEIVRENYGRIKDLEYNKKFEYLMGILIRKYGKDKKKALVSALAEILSEMK
ncbi:MAG: Asp-tRNA(Asn)/Glu-tRNA(Gln) amidotransferase subunit GatB [Nitrososphaeria archaeon]